MTFQFKIQIKNITKPPVWRRITMPSGFSFLDFHLAIQIAMGWGDAHMFMFSPKGFASSPQIELLYDEIDDFGLEMAGKIDAEECDLAEIFFQEKQKYTYTYDFGDNWEHTIVLEKILDELTKYPQLIAGKGKCPPEDCGGCWSYENIKEVLSDPKNPEYQSYREWLGLEANEDWDPSAFDLKQRQVVMHDVFSGSN